MSSNIRRFAVRAVAFSLTLVAIPTGAQGPIDCTKDGERIRSMKADFFQQGCTQLSTVRDELSKTLKTANRVSLAEDVLGAVRMMGCPL